MSAMSSATENRLLLLGLGVTAVATVGFIRRMLVFFRDTAKEPKPRAKTQFITQETEDALKPNTLAKLIESHNYLIFETATRIVCDRALHDDSTIDAVLHEITRPNHDRRERGLRVLSMLCNKGGIEILNKPRVYAAVVQSLSYSITDMPHEPYDPDFDNFEFRDSAERCCLMIAHRLILEFGVSGFVKASFIEKWLAKQPWGEREQEKQDNIMELLPRCNTLSFIVMRMIKDPRALKRLKKAGLINEALDLLNDKIDVRMVNGESTAGEGDLPDSTEGGPRHREQSLEEQNLRRRHREAMVLNDGTQPIGRDSIYERDEEATIEEDRLQRVTGLLEDMAVSRRGNIMIDSQSEWDV